MCENNDPPIMKALKRDIENGGIIGCVLFLILLPGIIAVFILWTLPNL